MARSTPQTRQILALMIALDSLPERALAQFESG
jgi:hypothetical protein